MTALQQLSAANISGLKSNPARQSIRPRGSRRGPSPITNYNNTPNGGSRRVRTSTVSGDNLNFRPSINRGSPNQRNPSVNTGPRESTRLSRSGTVFATPPPFSGQRERTSRVLRARGGSVSPAPRLQRNETAPELPYRPPTSGNRPPPSSGNRPPPNLPTRAPQLPPR